MRRRNDGSPWRRQFGELVPHGAVFETTPREEVIIQSMALGERTFPRVVEEEEESPVVMKVATVDGSSVAQYVEDHADEVQQMVPEEEWPLRLSPKLYLVRYPNGQHASLARRLTRGSE